MEKLMNTINGTYERAAKEGLGISKNLIRSLVKSNTIPYVSVGNNQVLINFNVLKSFLVTGSVRQVEPIPIANEKSLQDKIHIAR